MLRIVFAVMVSSFMFGCCSSRTEMDISSTSPFADYSGKVVTLTVPCVVYGGETGRTVRYPSLLVTKQSWDGVAHDASKELPFLEIPAGSRAFVLDTRWRRETGCVDLEEVYSRVLISPNDPRWPTHVIALFQHGTQGSSVLSIHSIGMRYFKGEIVAAPWERVGTPSSRQIDLPKPGKVVLEEMEPLKGNR